MKSSSSRGIQSLVSDCRETLQNGAEFRAILRFCVADCVMLSQTIPHQLAAKLGVWPRGMSLAVERNGMLEYQAAAHGRSSVNGNQDRKGSSQPDPVMQAMAAVFAKVSERETGMEKDYFGKLAGKAREKSGD